MKPNGQFETNADQILTIDQVAEYFQVHKRTVEAWIRDMGLPRRKMGTSRQAIVRFSRLEVDEWFRNRCSATATATATTDDNDNNSLVGV